MTERPYRGLGIADNSNLSCSCEYGTLLIVTDLFHKRNAMSAKGFLSIKLDRTHHLKNDDRSL